MLGAVLIVIGACQPKIKYITIYKKAKISCIPPAWPDFEDEEKHDNCFDIIAARRRNSALAYKALEEWEKYKNCVKNQSD